VGLGLGVVVAPPPSLVGRRGARVGVVVDGVVVKQAPDVVGGRRRQLHRGRARCGDRRRRAQRDGRRPRPERRGDRAHLPQLRPREGEALARGDYIGVDDGLPRRDGGERRREPRGEHVGVHDGLPWERWASHLVNGRVAPAGDTAARAARQRCLMQCFVSLGTPGPLGTGLALAKQVAKLLGSGFVARVLTNCRASVSGTRVCSSTGFDELSSYCYKTIFSFYKRPVDGQSEPASNGGDDAAPGPGPDAPAATLRKNSLGA